MLKKISAVLAGIMLLGSLPTISVIADTVETTVFEDKYSYADNQGLEAAYEVSEGQEGRVSLGTEGENRVLNVNLVPPDGTTMITKKFDSLYSAGDITLNYSVKPAQGLTTMFYLLKDNDVQEFPRFETDGKMYLDWNGTVVGDYTAGIWYDVTVKLSLDDQTYDISVQKQGSGEAPLTKTGVSTGLSGVNGLRMQVWTHSGGPTCFDNILVKHVVESVFPYKQDFESGNADGMSLVSAGETGCGVVDEDGNKVYKLGWEQDKGAPQLVRKLNGLTDGKLYIDADLKPMGNSKNQTQIFMNITKPDGNADCKNLIGFESSTGVRSGWDGPELLSSYTKGTWYHVNIVIDVATGKMNATISDGAGTEGAVTDVQIYDAGSAIKDVYFQIWTGGEDEFVYIDNVVMNDTAEVVDPQQPIPPDEPQTITLPYQQDFENVEQNAMKMGVGVIGENGKIVTEENGNKVFAVIGTGANGAPELQFDTPDISDGKFGIEADMKLTGTGCDSLVLLRYDDGLTQAALFDIDDGIFVDWRSATYKNGAFAVEQWYHVKINLDVDEGLMDAMITATDGGVYTVKDYRYDNQHRTIKSVNFQIWSDSGTTYVDNVKVTRNPSPISAPQVFTLPVTETFDGYSDMDALAEKWAMNEVTKNLACLDGTDTDKNLKLTLTKTEGTVMATYGFNEKLNDGFLKVTFDVIPSGTACTLIALYDANNQSCPMFFFSGGFVYGATAWDGDVGARFGSFKADECYTCEAIIDFETGKMDLSYKKKDAADNTKAQKSVMLASTWGERADIWRFLFQLWEATDGSSNLDNLRVEYADPDPILDINKVVFKKNGVVQSDRMKLNPLTDEIVIDFGTRTLHDTVRNGVSVKTADNTPIEIDYTFEGTKCIIKLIDGLNQNAQYVLTISKDIQNIIGAKAREDLNVNFGTTTGNLCVTERTFAADETDITTLAALKNAAEPILSIDYENGTEQPQTMLVLINSYKDNQLLKCHVEKMELAADEKFGVRQVNAAGKYENDADEVSVMIWDGLTAIRRLIGGIHLSDSVIQN